MKAFLSGESTLLATAFLLWLSVGVARGEGLYVESGATGTACSSHDPCGTVNDAIMMSAPGDIIYIGRGTFVENLVIGPGKDGLSLMGVSSDKTVLESSGGVPDAMAPTGVAVDTVLDILSPGVTVHGVTIRHPTGIATKRDVGIFVKPPAVGVHISGVRVERLREGEPTAPGSRGLLVFRATGTVCEESTFVGHYQDHIHLPTSGSTIRSNRVEGATRVGIVVIQESEDSLSVDNTIEHNEVSDSVGSDGIQIQGDSNEVVGNTLVGNGGHGIHLCGPGSGCVPPGGEADASANVVRGNRFRGNELGSVLDSGSDNMVAIRDRQGGAKMKKDDKKKGKKARKEEKKGGKGKKDGVRGL